MNGRTETIAWLQQRSQEQTRLRGQVIQLLREDPRVVAAWWFGSYARGESDALSDLDLWLVVDDRYLEQLVDQRYRYIEQLGQPGMVLQVWGNAPYPGAYLMANYLGPGGLYQVDWYWQAAHQARLPRDGRVIFDRIGLAPAPELVTTDFARTSRGITESPTRQSKDRNARLAFNTVFFWSMVPIVAKQIARGKSASVYGLLDMLVPMINTMAELLDIAPYQPIAPGAGQDTRESALNQLAALRRITAAAEAMEPAIAATGAELPSAIHAPIHTQLDRIEQLIRSGVSLQEIN